MRCGNIGESNPIRNGISIPTMDATKKYKNYLLFKEFELLKAIDFQFRFLGI